MGDYLYRVRRYDSLTTKNRKIRYKKELKNLLLKFDQL